MAEAVLELIAGSYEQVVCGYRVKTDEKEWVAEADFTHHSHTASISAVAASERFVVTGSKDETIQLYDLKKRVEHGALLHHNGTITCLQFYGSSHLLSGADDGLICVWSTKKWECLKSIKAHKGSVSSLSVHPSGKLALSVGTDKTLRTWNLITGRSAFIKNIKQNAEMVRWSPEGDRYVVVINDKVDIYDTATASNLVLVVAGDDETVRLCDIQKQTWICDFKAHETRVKAVDSFSWDDHMVLVTASNDGFIKMWKLQLKEALERPTLLGAVNTLARLTCLSVWKPASVKKQEEAADPATTSSQIPKDLLPTKKVRLMEEVILEDESKPPKRKRKKKTATN
ncbi:unnamed protein product [Knipowitschia caucasica]